MRWVVFLLLVLPVWGKPPDAARYKAVSPTAAAFPQFSGLKGRVTLDFSKTGEEYQVDYQFRYKGFRVHFVTVWSQDKDYARGALLAFYEGARNGFRLKWLEGARMQEHHELLRVGDESYVTLVTQHGKPLATAAVARQGHVMVYMLAKGLYPTQRSELESVFRPWLTRAGKLAGP